MNRQRVWATSSEGVRWPAELTTAEVAALLGVSDRAVRGLCRRGQSLPRAELVDGAWWIAVGDVSRYLERQGRRPLTVAELVGVIEAA